MDQQGATVEYNEVYSISQVNNHGTEYEKECICM